MPRVHPSGLLNVNKPTGMTSRRVVDRIVKLSGKAKVGHAGTLDPLATGVLVLGVGKATRLVEYIQRMKKRYRGTFLFGRTSPTEDTDGEVTLLENQPIPTLDEIQQAAELFIGPIEQRPPAYSALKIGGRRAYDLARQGKTVSLAPRPITVHSLQIVGYAYPELTLDIQCSRGTYVRSLGRDLAQSLGTEAVMSALTRTAIGRFDIHQAVTLEQLTEENWSDFLQPLVCAVEDLPQTQLSGEEVRRIRNGQTILRPTASWGIGTEIAALNETGHLVAIVTPKEPGLLKPVRNLSED